MADRITRVGLTAKRGLDAASGVLAELAGWLEARGAEPVFETETAQLAGVPAGRPTVSRDDLPGACDLLVVLGGTEVFGLFLPRYDAFHLTPAGARVVAAEVAAAILRQRIQSEAAAPHVEDQDCVA